MPDIIGAPQPQPTFPQITINIPPEGMLIQVFLAPGISINHLHSDDTMHQLIRGYLAAHPDLMQELVREQIAAKRGQLAVIEHVKRSRND